jgi:hypothetical protein
MRHSEIRGGEVKQSGAMLVPNLHTVEWLRPRLYVSPDPNGLQLCNASGRQSIDAHVWHLRFLRLVKERGGLPRRLCLSNYIGCARHTLLSMRPIFALGTVRLTRAARQEPTTPPPTTSTSKSHAALLLLSNRAHRRIEHTLTLVCEGSTTFPNNHFRF